jgi:hypothetical protein
MGYEVEQLAEHIELNKDSIDDYHNSRNMILSICKDMQTQNPSIKNDLLRIIDELKANTKIVEQIHRGGGLTDTGTRLSTIPVQERVVSTQSTFTEEQIQERLERFTLVTVEECFQLPKGIWIRYFLKSPRNPQRRGLYRTGGFIIYKDEDRRYITLVSGHNQGSNPYTWSMQLENVHSIYAMKKNVRKFRSNQIDIRFGLRKGISGMLHQYVSYNQDLMKSWINNDTDILLVLYDVLDHNLHVRRPNQKKKSFMDTRDVEEDLIKQTILSGLQYQFEYPIQGNLIAGLIHIDDLPSLRKRKSKIKR